MNNLKDFEKRAVRHGEVILIPIDNLPDGVINKYSGDKYVIAHSETGHHHLAVGSINIFTLGNRTFLEAVKDSRIEHQKTFDKHETKPIFKGFFEIKIKQAYDYFAKKMEAVRD